MTVTTEAAGYASWGEWSADEYLAEYYAEVMPDERFALEFLAESLRRLPRVPVALEFGCGPTVHHAFPLAVRAGEIHMAEYLPANRQAVEKWLSSGGRGGDGAHDWAAFTREVLRLEGEDTSDEAVRAREQQTRDRITRVVPADAGDTDPLGPEARGLYPLVTTHYCAEGATSEKETWRDYMRNIAGMVAPGGALIVSACGAAEYYLVGERRFPCAGVTAQDLLACLSGLGFGDIDLRVREVPDHSEQGYGSVLFACAIKRA
jgi:hypothetical protein